MRVFLSLVFLVILLPAITVAQDVSVQQLYVEAKSFLGEGVGERVPEPLDKIFQNERVNVYVTGTNIVVGVVLKDAVVAEIKDGGITEPTVNIHIAEEGLNGLINGVTDHKQLILKDALRVEGVGAFNQAKFAVIMFLVKAWLSFS